MKRVSAQDLQHNPDEVQSMALAEPLTITEQGHDRLVLMSVEEYQRLKRRDRRSYAVEDLPEWLVEQVAASEMDPRFNDLDKLLD